jgi:hypothetical protein
MSNKPGIYKRFSDSNSVINERLWKFHSNDHLLHIHIPKTAGTWLKQILYNTESGSHRFNYGHRPVKVIKYHTDSIGYNWDDFNPFAIIRNPWDRLWSAYKYTKWGGDNHLRPVELDNHSFKMKSKNPTELYLKPPPEITNKIPLYNPNREILIQLSNHTNDIVTTGWAVNTSIGKNSFKEYITNLYKAKEEFTSADVPWHKKNRFGFHSSWDDQNIYLIPQKNFLVNEKGEVIVDNIYKTTEMKKFLDWAEKITGDQYLKRRTFQKQSYNSSTNEIHYYNVYDDEMINMVGDLYKEDIDYFNFDFKN